MKLIALCTLLCSTILTYAQPNTKDTAWKNLYRATPTRVHDLIHTKLECSFDYAKAQLIGKVWITATPHFYTTDSLVLDAKGMDISDIAIMKGATKVKLNYTNTGMELKIKLDKAYKANEKYTVYISYIAKPNEITAKGSSAISDAKGLYFINNTGADKDKPVQIWTQGETEATSVWVPTLDKTNQKSTSEFYLTVPSKYVTLSNGLLKSQKTNANNTRTDYWVMDLPHAPYLFFIGVGDFAIIKDTPYKGKEVSYYVEKDQAKYAKQVFGNTPEMIKFFSQKLGVDFPWQKYAQMVGRDYVSGAMENTTATLHQENAYQNTRELADGNAWEETIAHELFHQWFGDLVTAESWSNLTVNESFANYSEYLWNEYKYGKDEADNTNTRDMLGYISSGSASKDLVRFKYADKEDMFDAVSYNKGGRILHMLRNYVGDEAFFKSLQNYLTTNKFKAGEAHQLRLSFEEVTGMDLSWFFNQWYFGNGHPKLEISTAYDAATQLVMVAISQTQKGDKTFRLPLNIDLYNTTNKLRNTLWLDKKVDTFYIPSATKPILVDVDGDRILLTEKKENKTNDEYVVQYKRNPNYAAKREALEYFAKNKMPEISLGMQDKYAGLRRYTYEKIAALADRSSYIADVTKNIQNEKDNRTLAAAIKILAKEKNAAYKSIFQKNTNAVSYSVAGAALEGLASIDLDAAYTAAQAQKADAGGALNASIGKVILEKGNEADFEYMVNKVKNAPLSQSSFGALGNLAMYLTKITNLTKVKQGIDCIAAFKAKIPAEFLPMVASQFTKMTEPIGKTHGEEISKYIIEKMK